MNSKKQFNGGINADDIHRIIADGDYLNMENCRVVSSALSKNYQVQNIPSTIELFNPSTNITDNICIGRAIHNSRNRVVFCLYSKTNGSSIYAFDYLRNVGYKILDDSNVTGGLNFDPNYRIDRNIKIVDDLLLWTDNNKEPRLINMERAIAANNTGYSTDVTPYTFPLLQTDISLIKLLPVYPLTATLIKDTTNPNNYLPGNFFQFTYYYDYIDGQTSALAPYSNPISYTAATSGNNCIRVSMPTNTGVNYIPQDVQRVNFVVRIGNSGKSIVIKIYDKENSDDASVIGDFNQYPYAGWYFNFYNNERVSVLDDTTANTSFDYVPLKAKTLEIAGDRLHLAHFLSGYDAAANSSLKVGTTTSNAPTYFDFKSGSRYIFGVKFFDKYRRTAGVNRRVTLDMPTPTYTNWIQNINRGVNFWLSNLDMANEIPDWAHYYQIVVSKNQTKNWFIQGWYYWASYAKKDSDGIYTYNNQTFDYTNTKAIAIDISTLTSNNMGYSYSEGDQAILYLTNGTNYTLPVIGVDGNNILLSPQDIGAIKSGYKFDINAQQTGIDIPLDVTLQSYFNNTGYFAQSNNDPSQHDVPANVNNNITVTDGKAHTFVFTLNNFKIQFTDTQDKTHSFYIQIKVKYANSWSFYTVFTQTNIVGGQIYEYNESIEIPVIAQNGGNVYIMAFYQDSNNLTGTFNILSGTMTVFEKGAVNYFEIYTPYKSSDTIEPLYEATPVFDITNPETDNRAYSTLHSNGNVANANLKKTNISGDTYVVSRPTLTPNQTIQFEAMSSDDKYYNNWDRNLGWPSYSDYIGQSHSVDSILYSNTYIYGSKNNGLNKFISTNQKNIGTDAGEIQKLQLANKMQENGNLLLIITNKQALVAYLSEVALMRSASEDGLITTADVLGSIHQLRNSFGTIHPESVCYYNGNVWWFDAVNGVMVQYDNNGVLPISDAKMHSFFDRYAKKLNTYSQSQLNDFSGFSYIDGCPDPSTGTMTLTLPKVESDSFAEELPSYFVKPDYMSELENKFSSYDGRAKQVVYDFNKNRITAFNQWLPDCMEYAGNKLFGWKNGVLYSFNENTASFNTIFGTEYPQRICLLINDGASVIKDLFNIAIEGNCAPDYTAIYSNKPNEQITDLVAEDYKNIEGNFYADFFRDRLSPNTQGSAEDKMFNGDVIKSQAAMIMVEFRQYNQPLEITFVNVGYDVSKGQNAIIQ